MTIWMVTGVHRQHWALNAVQNFSRQTLENKRLIVVENGQGVGVMPLDLPNVVVLQSQPGCAEPLNVALAWLREHADLNDWFAKCDADDYYGPLYLDAINLASCQSDYCGQRSLYIRAMDGHLWFAEAPNTPHVGVFAGPTLAARIGTALDFPVVRHFGEDAMWGLAMRKAGRVAMERTPTGMCYQRWAHNDHAWPCTDPELVRAMESPVWDLGALENYDIVNGLQSRPAGTLLDGTVTSIEQHMAVRLLREQQLSNQV